MRGVLAKAAADLSRRRLQTAVIGIVVLLSSAAGALALNLLLLADAPFQRAFAAVSGAHLAVAFDASRAGASQLTATASLPPVAASAGPFRGVTADIDRGPSRGGQVSLRVVGRAGPGGAVDRVTLLAGRWVQSRGEAVVAASHGFTIGDTLEPVAGSGLPPLTVVGVAQTVGDPAEVWVLPAQIPAGTPAERSVLWMYYRLRHASTDPDVALAANAIAADLPRGSIVATQSWLQVQRNIDITTSVMVPFLLAFCVCALLAGALVIANLVSGAVIAGYRDIGIMKSIGFTPSQVVSVLALQMLAPGALGCLAGVPLGVLGSQPVLAETSLAFDLPPTFTTAAGADAALLWCVLAVIAAAAVAPALRAGRLTAVEAITRGMAPQVRSSARLARILGRVPAPRALSLGIGDSLARPTRSLMTLLAITIAVATVAFATGLIASLQLVSAHLFRDQEAPVIAIAQGGPGQDFGTLIAAQPGTAREVAETDLQASIGGVVGQARLTSIRGDSSWLGYEVITGRWIRNPGEVVVTPWLLHQAHAVVGDRLTVTVKGHLLVLRVVGTYLDQGDDDLLMIASWSDLAAAGVPLSADYYEVGLVPGTDPPGYAAHLREAAPPGAMRVAAKGSSQANTSFLLVEGVLVWLAAILASVGMAGVFNTVVLNTGEKSHTIAILKAIGMTPGQTVAMVLCSVAVLGIAGGLFGLPVGEALHHRILISMLDIAARTMPPPSFFDVFRPLALVGLVLAGIGVAMAGGWVPASWAAGRRVTEALRSE